MKLSILVSVLVFGLFANASDFYVITSTHPSQAAAQRQAAEKGGWVLISSLYTGLAPNTYAVVRGPFKNQKDADKELASLKRVKGYATAYAKNAGDLDFNGLKQIKTIPAQVIAALLGEIRIESEKSAGGTNPCEEQAPHESFSLSYEMAAPQANDSLKAETVKLDIKSLTRINSTGEVTRMRGCFE